MMRKSFKHIPPAEERRVVRTWNCGVPTFYGALALSAYRFVSLSHHLANGSKVWPQRRQRRQ